MNATNNELWKHLFAGTCAGMTSTVLLHPLDLIKVRMQVYQGQGKVYPGIWSGCRNIISEEGFLGLYAGLTPAVMAAALSWGGYFYFYESSKNRKLHAYQMNMLSTNQGNKQPKLHIYDHLLSGIEAGCVMVILTNPLWLMKTRLQLQGHTSSSSTSSTTPAVTQKYKNFRDTVSTLLKEEGVFGFYKGFLPAILLTSHGAVQFAAYEQLKLFSRSLFGEDKNLSTSTSTILTTIYGSLSKIIASTVTYPYQVIKSRMQQRGAVYETTTSSQLSSITGTFQCIRNIYATNGLRGFFKGIIPNTLRVVPSAAITFVVYEDIMRYLRRTQDAKY